MRLNRAHELFLIELGIEYLKTLTIKEIEVEADIPAYRNDPPYKKKKKKKRNMKINIKHKWTPEQRRKFSETMKKKWKQKKTESAEKP